MLINEKDRLTAVENLVEHRGIEPLTSGLQILAGWVME